VLAPSQFAARLIARHHSIPAERIGAIPPSIETSWFDPAAVRPDRIAAVREAWGIRAGERIVLAPRRAAAVAEQLTLVDAARMLINGGLRDVVFVVLREDAGENTDVLELRLAAQGLASVFRCVGGGADRPAAYAAAELVVLPAERALAFEEAGAEALAMARPLIAASAGALTELVLAPPRVAAEERTGWLTKPRDALGLARALAAALTLDEAAYREICQRARRFAERKFSAARITEAILTVYGALLEGGGR
jgi:glycosyltransferase involved in cell wall biosynthesis